MLQTQHTGTDPTDTQYNYAKSVTLPVFHFLQSFAFTDGAGNYSLVVFNVSRDYAQPINFGGIVPSGTVNVQQLTSANITDTNETSNVVKIQPVTFATSMTLPPYSMTTFTWGAGTQAAPVIRQSLPRRSLRRRLRSRGPRTKPLQARSSTARALLTESLLNAYLETSHSVTLTTGLTPSTTYDFAVISTTNRTHRPHPPTPWFRRSRSAPR